MSAKHTELLRRVQRFDGLDSARLAHVRDDGSYLSTRKVTSLDGTLIHDDHGAWMRAQLAADNGNAAATRRRLRSEGYLLTKCDVRRLYLVVDRLGPDQADFVQIEVDVEDESLDQRLFEDDPSSWRTFNDLSDLMHDCGDSPALQGEARKRFRPIAYRFNKATDVVRFVNEADALEQKERAKWKHTQFELSDSYTGVVEKMVSIDELTPGWDRHPVKARRLFDDWSASSAGRGGARICDHWVMDMTDYTDDKGDRWLTLIPIWTTKLKLAEVDPLKGDTYTFFGRLQTLDRRVKVPMGWYFYMLHGNRVPSEAGERVLRDAEAGLIVLPEHDYQVLKAWRAKPYGF